ncbi:MAG: glycosyltransferase family A protein [Nitrososphaeraceae archaeon]
MGTYFAIVTCRNSENNIEEALQSLKNQTLKPEYVVVIDDGSKDKTPEILKRMQGDWNSLYTITNPDLGYDIGRVVSNWNKALKLVQELNLKKTDYHLIATDDTVYEEKYAEKIIKYMDTDPMIAIASGNYDDKTIVAPHGAGRFVRTSFFDSHHSLYPEKMGYESLVLYTANRYGYTYKVYNDARFIHTRELGEDHHFYQFGASMRTLGYHPLFVIGRFFLYFISGKPIGRKGAIYMLYHYLTYSPKNEGYDSMYNKEIRKFIRSAQYRRIKNILKGGTNQ